MYTSEELDTAIEMSCSETEIEFLNLIFDQSLSDEELEYLINKIDQEINHSHSMAKVIKLNSFRYSVLIKKYP